MKQQSRSQTVQDKRIEQILANNQQQTQKIINLSHHTDQEIFFLNQKVPSQYKSNSSNINFDRQRQNINANVQKKKKFNQINSSSFQNYSFGKQKTVIYLKPQQKMQKNAKKSQVLIDLLCMKKRIINQLKYKLDKHQKQENQMVKDNLYSNNGEDNSKKITLNFRVPITTVVKIFDSSINKKKQ